MLQYIPAPNTAIGFATSSFNQIVRDDKGAVRLDGNTRWGLLSGYYFIDDFNLDNPILSRRAAPAFRASMRSPRAAHNLLALGDTKTFNATAVNELHFSYMRDYTNLGQPVGGLGVSLTSQGFENADGTPSIVALDPKGEGVENLNFNGYSTGAAANQLIQVNNTYQVTDSFLQGPRQPLSEVWRGVPCRPGQCHSDRAVQWQFRFLRPGNGYRLCRLPDRRAQPI